MRKFNTIYYLLFILLVMGAFASMAQNSYGLKIMGAVAFIFGLLLIVYFKVLNYINYAVVIGFIYLFYKNYIKISSTDSTKTLMKDILRTRRTVQYYVWYNLGMITLSMFLGFALAFVYNPEMSLLKDKIAHENGNKTLLITCGIMITSTVVFVGIFWLFYKLLYGILLR